MNIYKRCLLVILLSVCVCLVPGVAFASAQPNPLDHAAITAQQSSGNSISSTNTNNLTVTASGGVKGIDVSEHQGTIDWAAVKASGVNYAILRVGYGSNSTYQDDKCFSYNVSECERLGIPYGVYLYSYAWDAASAKNEADHVIRLLSGHHPQYPVYYDLEYESNGQPAGMTDAGTIVYLSNSDLAKFAETFCDAIYDAGYIPAVYANLNWWNNYLTSTSFDSWERWVAQYNTTCDYKKAYSVWQYSSSGSISGISGNVDEDYDYCKGRSSAGVCLGDANGNGVINIIDAQIAFDAANGVYGTDLAKLVSLRSGWTKDTVTYLLDVNRNGVIDAGDAQAIQYLTHHQRQ